MLLNRSHVADYQRDGYVLLENVFTPAEVAAMLREVESGGRVATIRICRGCRWAQGRPGHLARTWQRHLGRCLNLPADVNNVRILMGEEVASFMARLC